MTISLIFVVLLGEFCIYSAISILLDPASIEKGYILSQQHNIFIKYSPSFCFGYAGIIFISIPFIFINNVMSLGENYLAANEHLKAKMTLAAHTIFLPATISFISSIYFSEGIKNKNMLLLLAILGVTYVFAKNSYVYFIKTKNIT
jgi:hypothetical protein